jgi:hypothetical protein
MMHWTRGRYAIEMTDEPVYSFGSTDNTRFYGHEFLLESDYRPSSKHGLQCFLDGEPCGSAVVGASGGSTGIHEHSCVLVADRCLVAIGDRVATLGLPDLDLIWQARVDDATCFGLHVTPDEKHVIVHGELAISKFTLNGNKEWEFSGQDIFTGVCAIRDGAIVVTDFNGQEYSIDLEFGCDRIVEAG